MPETQMFDLNLYANAIKARNQVMRLVVPAVAVGLDLGAIWLLFSGGSSGRWNFADFPVYIAALIVSVLAGVLLTRVFTRAATRVSITRDGVSFFVESRNIWSKQWSDPSFHLRIDDDRVKDPAYRPPPPFLVWVNMFDRGLYSLISPEAADAMVDEARNAAISVTERVDSPGTASARRIVVLRSVGPVG
jgi:hypothetical protein